MKLDDLIAEKEQAARRKGLIDGAKLMAIPAFLLGAALVIAANSGLSALSSNKTLREKDALSADLIKCYKDIVRYEDIMRLERDAVESWKKNHPNEEMTE